MVIQKHQSLWFTPQFKAISECRQKKFSQAEIQNKRGCTVALKPVRQTLVVWCGRREVFKRRYVLITKKKGKSKILSHGFCSFESDTEQMALQFCICIAQMYKVTPRLLNQINKIRATELLTGSSSFVIRTYLLLKTSLHPHQTRVWTRVWRTGFRATLRLRLL